MEGPSPRASRLLRDKLTHPAAPPRARCALTGARSPRASDAGSRRRRRRLFRPSTSAGGRVGASGPAAAEGRGGEDVRHVSRTAHAPSRTPRHAPRREPGDFPLAPALSSG